MNDLKKLEGYHKYLLSNAKAFDIVILDWDSLQFSHLNQYKDVISKKIEIMNFIQWNRSMKLEKIID